MDLVLSTLLFQCNRPSHINSTRLSIPDYFLAGQQHHHRNLSDTLCLIWELGYQEIYDPQIPGQAISGGPTLPTDLLRDSETANSSKMITGCSNRL
jgi:hypothetical protein